MFLTHQRKKKEILFLFSKHFKRKLANHTKESKRRKIKSFLDETLVITSSERKWQS